MNRQNERPSLASMVNKKINYNDNLHPLTFIRNDINTLIKLQGHMITQNDELISLAKKILVLLNINKTEKS